MGCFIPRKVCKVTISTQQIHTVLRTYNKQLKLSGFNNRRNTTPPQSKRDKVTISNEGKKQHVYKQATTPLVEKLTSTGMVSKAPNEGKQKG
jgi:hypothetical protein